MLVVCFRDAKSFPANFPLPGLIQKETNGLPSAQGSFKFLDSSYLAFLASNAFSPQMNACFPDLSGGFDLDCPLGHKCTPETKAGSS
jgi:hypothetical protein